MYLDKVDKLLDEHGGKGTIEIPEEVMEEYLNSCRKALESVFNKNKFRFPRPSGLGHPARKMWYMRNQPKLFEGEHIPAELRRTFYKGHMLEAFYVALFKMAGVPVEATAKKISLELDGETITGELDHIIGGMIFDSKTANDFSFQGKWKDQHTLYAKDNYHYVTQAAAYSKAEGIPFKGWFVYNSNNSSHKFVPTEGLPLDHELEHVEHNLKLSKQKEAPSYCYTPVEEEYKPKGHKTPYKTGNKHLNTECVKCPAYISGDCKPAKVVAIGKTNYGEIHYTEFKKNHKAYVKVEIIEE